MLNRKPDIMPRDAANSEVEAGAGSGAAAAVLPFPVWRSWLGECRWCGATILWVQSEHRRWVPLDPEPVPPSEGGVFVVDEALRRAYWMKPPAREAADALYRFHGARCPDWPGEGSG